MAPKEPPHQKISNYFTIGLLHEPEEFLSVPPFPFVKMTPFVTHQPSQSVGPFPAIPFYIHPLLGVSKGSSLKGIQKNSFSEDDHSVSGCTVRKPLSLEMDLYIMRIHIHAAVCEASQFLHRREYEISQVFLIPFGFQYFRTGLEFPIHSVFFHEIFLWAKITQKGGENPPFPFSGIPSEDLVNLRFGYPIAGFERL